MSDWRDKAACLDNDPENWFPEPTWKPAANAKKVCAGCPVRLACGQYAIENGIREGVWGGMTEDERLKLTRKKRVFRDRDPG